MKNNGFKQLFIDELEEMYSSENQIIHSMPKLIKLASSPELKESLTKHLKETQQHVERLEQIYSILNISIREISCDAIEGLLKEAEDIIEKKQKSPLLDAAIISAVQKVEHYEIASYGTLRSFAKQLELDRQIVSLLQDTLDEEGAVDKKLTKIAEGTLFTTGINQEAVEEDFAQSIGRKGRK